MIERFRYYRRVLGWRGAWLAFLGSMVGSPRYMDVKRPEISESVRLRVPSSDAAVYDQVYREGEYNFRVRRAPKVIVDAGANTGLACGYFASQFPGARVIAVEPEAANCALLRHNTRGCENVEVLQAAVWCEDTDLEVVDSGLGSWGFMTRDGGPDSEDSSRIVHTVKGMTVDSIMDWAGVTSIDILKIDIEGAEKEVFKDPSKWIARVDTLIIELHDRMKPGCSRSFFASTGGFVHEWVEGENVYLSRSGGCLGPPGTRDAGTTIEAGT